MRVKLCTSVRYKDNSTMADDQKDKDKRKHSLKVPKKRLEALPKK